MPAAPCGKHVRPDQASRCARGRQDRAAYGGGLRPVLTATARSAFQSSGRDGETALQGESPGGVSPPGALRTEHETLASLGSHQANVPVIPIRQCSKRLAQLVLSRSRKRLARTLWALNLSYFRLTQARSL